MIASGDTVSTGLSKAQQRFLRALGCPSDDPDAIPWPQPMVLDRWIHNKAFRRHFFARTAALKREIRLHLLASALEAARHVCAFSLLPPQQHPGDDRDRHPRPHANTPLRDSLERIKLWMASERIIRARRPQAKDNTPQDEDELTFEEAAVRLAHPNAPRDEVIAFFRRRADAARAIENARQNRNAEQPLQSQKQLGNERDIK